MKLRLILLNDLFYRGTGPRGTVLKINGTYESIEELEKHHPEGKNGDCYIVQKSLIVWDEDTKTWISTE